MPGPPARGRPGTVALPAGRPRSPHTTEAEAGVAGEADVAGAMGAADVVAVAATTAVVAARRA